MEAKCNYDRMDLSVVSMISLLFICKFERIIYMLRELAWRRVDRKSIIF